MMQRRPRPTTTAACTGKWLPCIGTPEGAREGFVLGTGFRCRRREVTGASYGFEPGLATVEAMT